MNKLTLLGTGTCQLQAERKASSVLIQLEGTNIIYDFGRGIAQRTVDVGLKHDDIEHIVISHFHPDHFSDLIPYFHSALWSKIDNRSKDINIYGPIGIEARIDAILEHFVTAVNKVNKFEVKVHTIEEGEFEIDGYSFEAKILQPADNHGIKFSIDGKVIALTGDSEFHQEEVEFLKGVDVAVFDAGHISKEEIVGLAVNTQVGKLVCSHQYYELDQRELQKEADSKGYKGEIIVGEDLMEFNL